MAIVLPTEKVPAKTQDPKRLIIFSKPKRGKTTALAALDNCLIVDTENGSDYVDALKVKVQSIQDINELCKQLKAANCPYKFIALDTITMLEEVCKPLALKLYQATPAGANFNGDIITAPNGSGWGFLRTAVEMVIDRIESCTKNLILVCHCRDAAIDKSELTIKQIDLSGKLGRILAAKADAIGLLDRDEDSNTILSFDTSDKFTECGARPQHLRNKVIQLGEMKEDGTLEFHWERIFHSLG
jgi:hypothetical protein